LDTLDEKEPFEEEKRGMYEPNEDDESLECPI
jgi:hypothetical protein